MKNPKQKPGDLALFGGLPAFPEPLHVGKPNAGDRRPFFERLDGMFERGWFTNDGPLVRELETRLAERLGVKHCVAICNGTSALEILFRALGLSGEVILPAFTFIATAHALANCGLKPVFCDIDPVTLQLDPAKVVSLITPRTSAILGVHLFGRTCAIEELTAISRQNALKLVFDSAHAFDCTYRGQKTGRFGDAEVFSFHATKIFHTFEGGAVTTNDDALAASVRLIRNFGFTGYDEVVSGGTNGKMSEPCAAMGLSNLENIESFKKANRRNFLLYGERLGQMGLPLLSGPAPREESNFHYVVCEWDGEKIGLSRDALVQILHAENILARRYFFPGCHRFPPYLAKGAQAVSLPCVDRAAARTVVLPTGMNTTEDQIERVCEIIRFVKENAAACQNLLPA